MGEYGSYSTIIKRVTQATRAVERELAKEVCRNGWTQEARALLDNVKAMYEWRLNLIKEARAERSNRRTA